MILNNLVALEVFKSEKILGTFNQRFLGQCADDLSPDHGGPVTTGPVVREFIYPACREIP